MGVVVVVLAGSVSSIRYGLLKKSQEKPVQNEGAGYHSQCPINSIKTL